jgi:hypothetical protein
MKLYDIVAVLGTLGLSAVGGSNISLQSPATESAKSPSTMNSQAAEQAGRSATNATGNQNKTPNDQADDAVIYRPGAGTSIICELSRPLEARKLKVDDKVECALVQDLLYKGKIVVSRTSKAWGHVTEVVRDSKDHPESRIGLVFDRVILPGKKEAPFQYPAIIIAVAAPIRSTTVQTTKMTDMPVQMAKGKDTGGAVIGAMQSNAQLAGANMSSSTGAISAANRGVIGIKNVALDNSNPNYSALVSPKGSMRLDFDVQILLQVTAPPKPQ